VGEPVPPDEGWSKGEGGEAPSGYSEGEKNRKSAEIKKSITPERDSRNLLSCYGNRLRKKDIPAKREKEKHLTVEEG